MRAFVLAFLLLTTAAKAGTALDAIKHANALSCGVNNAANDETKDDTHGNTAPFGADLCRAVAAALHVKASLHGFPSEERAYMALAAKQIALFVGATPNPALARRYVVAFLRPVFFDGQGLLVHKGRGVASCAIWPASMCVSSARPMPSAI